MVVQIGKTKRETFLFTFKLSSADAMVTGNVAAELLVNRATAKAGDIFLNTVNGLSPLRSRKIGKTMKNWITFPPITTATYLPREPTITPASIWAASWPAKATIPIGNTYTMPLIRVKSNSWRPFITFISICTFSVFGILARPRPTAKAIKRIDNTLPAKNGWSKLLGITDKKWS